MPVTKDNLNDVFTYHPPTDEDKVAYAAIRAVARELAAIILAQTPPCADQQAAIRLLREAVMTANAAIATRGAV